MNDLNANIPKKPRPPLSSYIREDGGSGSCPFCGSSMIRKIPIFGKKMCIHPDCGFRGFDIKNYGIKT